MTLSRAPTLFAAILAARCVVAAPYSPEWTHNYAAGLGSPFEAICTHITNSQECYESIEKYQLDRKPEGISREGRFLTVTPKSGPPVILVNTEPDERSGRWYHFVKTLPAAGYHLIQVQLWESQIFFLANVVTGRVIEVPGLPVVSPDSSRFVLGRKTSIGALTPAEGEVQIWRFGPESPRLEWAHHLVGFAPETLEWQGEASVRVVVAGNRAHGRHLLGLTLHEDKWRAGDIVPLR